MSNSNSSSMNSWKVLIIIISISRNNSDILIASIRSIGDTIIYESSYIGSNTSYSFNKDIDSITIINYDTSIFKELIIVLMLIWIVLIIITEEQEIIWVLFATIKNKIFY